MSRSSGAVDGQDNALINNSYFDWLWGQNFFCVRRSDRWKYSAADIDRRQGGHGALGTTAKPFKGLKADAVDLRAISGDSSTVKFSVLPAPEPD